MKTFEDATDKSNDDEQEEENPAKEGLKEIGESMRAIDVDDMKRSPVTFEGKSLEVATNELPTILTATPDDLGSHASSRRNRNRSEFGDTIRDTLYGGVGLDPEELEEALEDDELKDAQLTQAQVMQKLLSTVKSQTKMMNVLVDTNVSLLSTMNDILSSVEPALSITVEGSNTIDNANEAQPVVPGSESTEVATKVVKIAADKHNDDTVRIGTGDVKGSDGFPLDKGDSETFEVDIRDQVLYMASETAGQKVHLVGMI